MDSYTDELVLEHDHNPIPGAAMTKLDPADEMQTSREALEMHLVQALSRCESDTVRDHLQAALRYCRELPATPLVECPLCGAVGLPERIHMHDCSTFRNR
jgi:ribosomal protein L32